MTDLAPVMTEVKSIGQKTSGALDEQNAKIARLSGRLETIEAKQYDGVEGGLGFGHDSGGGALPIGVQVAEADSVKHFVAGNSRSARVEVKAITRATADIHQAQRHPGIVPPKEAPLCLRALLEQNSIQAADYEWPRESAFVNNADYQLAEGDLKAESDLQLELAQARVHTIAHWVEASKQVLADAVGLSAYIDARLMFGVEQKVETELLYGAGGTGAIHGLMQQAPAFAGTAGDSLSDQIRKAMTGIRKVRAQPDAILLAEEDWETIELKRDDEGRYELPGLPSDCADATLWKTPVIPCASMNPGEFLVGELSRAALLLQRDPLTVEISGEDVDNFRRNMCTILAEERIGLAVLCPSLLRAGTFA